MILKTSKTKTAIVSRSNIGTRDCVSALTQDVRSQLVCTAHDISSSSLREMSMLSRKTLIFVLLLVSVVLVSGCTQENPSTGDVNSNPVIGKTNISNQSTANVKEFSITAKQFEFQPSTITVKKGDHVKLTIRSIDVKHGFALPDFDVRADLEPNKETVVEFTADKTGTFTFFCSVVCGSGHSDMKGKLIVE